MAVRLLRRCCGQHRTMDEKEFLNNFIYEALRRLDPFKLHIKILFRSL